MYALLFFDDWHIHSRTNLTRKIGKPQLVQESIFRDPDADLAWAYPSVIKDPYTDTWKCYYQGEVSSDGATFIPLLAESADGLHWTRPDLTKKVILKNRLAPNQLFEIDNFAEWCGVYPDPFHEGTDEWLKALISLRPSKKLALEAIVGKSRDGINWRLEKKAKWHPTGSDPGHFAFWNPYRNSYVLSLRPYLADRRQAVSETRDWQTFTEPTLLMQPDALDTPAALFYGMPVIQYEQMFIGLLWIYHTDPTLKVDDKFQGFLKMHKGDDHTRIMGKIDCQLTYSTNGWHFQRTIREPFIPNGEPGDPTSGCIYPSSIVNLGDKIRIYSSASIGEHAQLRADPSLNQGSILTHELRKDGFIYLEPPGGTGEFTTKWVLWKSGEININVSVPFGEILVEIMDQYGNPINGYTYAESIPFKGNSNNYVPKWNNDKHLSQLSGRVIKIGVRIANGRIFALRGDYQFMTTPQVRQYVEAGIEPEARLGY